MKRSWPVLVPGSNREAQRPLGAVVRYGASPAGVRSPLDHNI